jgi:hypothetical protein
MKVETHYPKQTGERIVDVLTFSEWQELRVAGAVVEKYGSEVARRLTMRSYFSADEIANQNSWNEAWVGMVAQDLRAHLAREARGYNLSSVSYIDQDVELIRGSFEAATKDATPQTEAYAYMRAGAAYLMSKMVEVDNLALATER